MRLSLAAAAYAAAMSTAVPEARAAFGFVAVSAEERLPPIIVAEAEKFGRACSAKGA